MKLTFVIAFMLALTGCTHIQSKVQSPYERYLPQTLPSEINRIEFPAGYSIVSPVGWTARTISIEKWAQSSVLDQIVIESHVADDYPPKITIRHLGPDMYALYHEMLHAESLPDGWKRWSHTEFQGQPALEEFLPGYGHRQAVGYWLDRSYQPWLNQQIFCERDGNGFILSFTMRNADKDQPYYTQALPIIDLYFETFRFKKPSK